MPRRLQLLCLFSITLNVPFKNLSNKCRKAFAPPCGAYRRPCSQTHHAIKNPPTPNPQARLSIRPSPASPTCNASAVPIRPSSKICARPRHSKKLSPGSSKHYADKCGLPALAPKATTALSFLHYPEYAFQKFIKQMLQGICPALRGISPPTLANTSRLCKLLNCHSSDLPH